MAEAERTKERNELKIKKRDYTGYDDEEFVEGREGMKRRILSKYDEFLEGAKETVSNRVYPRPLHSLGVLGLSTW
jgi:U4/U6.U5 tri-snRNP-associated protein 1